MAGPRPIVQINSNAEAVRDSYSRFLTNIPEVQRDLAWEIAKIFSQEIQRKIVERDLRFTRRLFYSAGLRNIIPEGNGFKIDISRFSQSTGTDVAAWHEFAGSGHWVSPYRHPILMRWAQRNLSGGINSSENMIPTNIFVTPTPFVKPAIQPAARRMREATPSNLEEKLEEMLEVTAPGP